MIYLGAWDSQDSRTRFAAELDLWSLQQNPLGGLLTVDDLTLRYLRHADEFYRRPDGEPTSEPVCIRHALRFLIASHGRTRVREFGPLALKAVRKSMIEAGLARTTINKQVHRITRLFGWAVENELAPVDVHQALQRVASLKAGRTVAAEPEPVQPVPEGDVEATLPHLPNVLQAMVRLQLVTGARPGEICGIRPCDVTFGTDGVWTYRPPLHKTSHRGKERRIHIGPQGQDILRPYLNREAETYCFRPCDSEAERNAEKRAGRKSPRTPSQSARKPKADRTRPPGQRYTKDGYCKAIYRACKSAGVESWSPNQLRHSRATLLRKLYGIEAARLVLGHADAGMTQQYAERDFDAAAKIMMEIG